MRAHAETRGIAAANDDDDDDMSRLRSPRPLAKCNCLGTWRLG
jgi:hypothetical protein